jgi:hypothetical protein
MYNPFEKAVMGVKVDYGFYLKRNILINTFEKLPDR